MTVLEMIDFRFLRSSLAKFWRFWVHGAGDIRKFGRNAKMYENIFINHADNTNIDHYEKRSAQTSGNYLILAWANVILNKRVTKISKKLSERRFSWTKIRLNWDHHEPRLKWLRHQRDWDINQDHLELGLTWTMTTIPWRRSLIFFSTKPVMSESLFLSAILDASIQNIERADQFESDGGQRLFRRFLLQLAAEFVELKEILGHTDEEKSLDSRGRIVRQFGHHDQFFFRIGDRLCIVSDRFGVTVRRLGRRSVRSVSGLIVLLLNCKVIKIYITRYSNIWLHPTSSLKCPKRLNDQGWSIL